mmetsp:Transcript_18771/g.59003  ORF Transcript_18771/g.59003 Transcript_18771/m.59003 type:complete len:258 (-) Transcript_18771:234-1007(-)
MVPPASGLAVVILLVVSGEALVMPSGPRQLAAARCAEASSRSEVAPEASKESKEVDGSGAAAAAAAATAAGGIVAATTTAATTVCATGACAVGAAAVSGGATTAAATATTAAVGSQVAAAIGALGLTSLAAFSGPVGDLRSMAASSVELPVAVANGKPSVLEFYSLNCPHCNEAAKTLYAVERGHQEINWVMVDTDLEQNRMLWESLGVYEIPHFAFLDADENLRATAIGPIDKAQAERGIALALANDHAPVLLNRT